MTLHSPSQRCVLAAVLAACLSAPAAAQVRVGPLGGYSLLEHVDTSLSHGPLEDAATVGRTWLLGAVLDAHLTGRDVLSAEFVWGPYHNDADHYCISNLTTGACTPETMNQTSHAMIVGLQYLRILGRGSWRPYVGGGLGFKRYSFDSEWDQPSSYSAAILTTFGVRSTGRRPVRIEGTALFVPNHPILNDKMQFELQARVVALLF
jgi:hypothetical protein